MGQPVKIKREKEKSVALKRLTQAQSNNRRVRPLLYAPSLSLYNPCYTAIQQQTGKTRIVSWPIIKSSKHTVCRPVGQMKDIL